MINMHYQINMIWNGLGNKPFVMPVSGYINLILVEKNPPTGNNMEWKLKINKKDKRN